MFKTEEFLNRSLEEFKMRKLMLVMSVLALSVTLGSMTASAQTQISLDGTATGGVTFTPAGGGNVFMDVTTGGLLSGTATGTGAFGFLGNSLTWTLTGGPVGLQLVADTPPVLAEYFAVAGTLNLDVMSGAIDELSGTLNLVDLSQNFNSGNTDNLLLANLTGLSGALAPSFGGAGTVQVTIDLTGVGFLPNLSSTSSLAPITHGFITPTATPEPTSLLLLGTGLLSMGGFLRRRILGA
jgi:hypothetical protein